MTKEEQPHNGAIAVARTIGTNVLSSQETVVPTGVRVCTVTREMDTVRNKHTTYMVSTSAKYVATFVPWGHCVLRIMALYK